MNIRKMAITGSLFLGGVLASVAAHAGVQVQWQIALPVPVYQVPVYQVPAQVIIGSPYDYRAYQAPRRWDADGDGIPNRYDRRYNPRWDVDGDGIPNRYDAYPYDPRNGRGRGGHDFRRHDGYYGR